LAEVNNIVSKSIVALGTDEAFALRDSEGEIRAFKQKVRLTAADGTLTQPVPGGPFVVSAQGYEILAEGAGACCIFPMNVLVDGQMHQNPYVLRDNENRRILAIYCRAIAFRFSSKGIPQVADWTTIFDTPSYRLIDLLAKAKKHPAAFRLLPAEMPPPNGDENATWARYPFDESSNLWINTAHEEALQWYAQIINREKKAIDYAQTFARRNAMKHLLGVQKAPGPVWDVPVLCWRPTTGSIVKWDATQYLQLQQRVEGVIRGSGGFENKQIEMRKGVEDVTNEPLTAAIEHEVDQDETEGARDFDEYAYNEGSESQRAEEAQAEAAPPKSEEKLTPQPPKAAKKPEPPRKTSAPKEPPLPQGLTEEEETNVKNARLARKAFPKEYKQALEEMNMIDDGKDLPPAAAAMVVDKINRYLDALEAQASR
jgi:hypothetical protein